VEDQTVTITQAGTYVVSGSLSNGQLVVNVNKEEKVHLIFAGVTITNEDGAAVVIEQAEKVITTLASDTTNTLIDGSSYTLAEGETEPDAAFYSKEDLSINGDGTLVITGNYSNAVSPPPGPPPKLSCPNWPVVSSVSLPPPALIPSSGSVSIKPKQQRPL